MIRRTHYTVIAFGVLLASACAAFAIWTSKAPPDAVIQEQPQRNHLWPMQRCATWQLNNLNGDVRLSVRSIERDIMPGESPTGRPDRIERSASTHTVGTGWCLGGNQPFKGHVTSQVVNLSDVALDPRFEKQPLRLLVSFGMGGATTRLNSKDTIIQGDCPFATIPHETATWSDDELHLLNVYTRTENKVFVYDVFLERRPSTNTSEGR